MNSHSVNFVIDEIISDLGYYSPIELLLRQGRCRYVDYENWRYGKLDFITEHFMGSAKRINNLLTSARDYVLQLEFTAEPGEFYGWKGDKANQLLAFGKTDSEVEIKLLNTQYRRQQSAPQLDLFFDNQSVQLANELIQALAGRNAELAEHKLNQLEQVDPGHALCGQAATLLDALQRLELQSELPQPLQQLDEIKNRLLPLAQEALQGRTRDFIAPFWRQLALQLDTYRYTGDYPELHSAYCYMQVMQWPEVISSIESTANWRKYSSLYSWHSQALYLDNQRSESLQLVCDYCWSFPQQQPDFIVDAHSSESYSVFMDLELDEKWGWFHFPCWLLLNERGLAVNIKIDQIKTDQQYSNEAFTLLLQLLQPKQLGNIELRSRLKVAHSGIFKYFLAKFSQS